MHGRLKVKTTAEQQERKRKEREEKVKKYNGATALVFGKRKQGTLDEEALYASSKILEANPDFYTLWNIRREIYTHFKENKSEDDLQRHLEEELFFIEGCLRVNPKSYGSWHQRCWVLDHIPRPDWKRELGLCNKFLEYDERNFHCWDYRRFVVQRSKVPPEEEFVFTSEKISRNFSNYSSWHYRSKMLPLIHPDPQHPVGVEEEALLNEFELVQNAFFTDPNDQSAWFYHRWLLGRGSPALCIRSAYTCRKTGQTVIVISKAVKIDNSSAIEIKLNEINMDIRWFSPGGGRFSQIWVSSLPKDHLKEKGEYTVKVTLKEGGSTVTMTMRADEQEASYSKDYKPGTMFSYELSAATSTILTQELESCEQLHELEPDNKWTLLTIVSLMRALDPLKYEKQMLEYLQKLIQVDPCRTNYYTDLRSKYLIENYIESSTKPMTVVDLSDKDMSSLYHTDHLVLTKELNVSGNRLRQLKGVSSLQCVQKLNLDRNQLTSCDALGVLNNLAVLSLRDNNIESPEDLQGLSSCENLHTLNLVGNPVLSTEDAVNKIKQILPGVKSIDC